MFANYGDVNFFELGCLVDKDLRDNEFRILYCRPFDDESDLFLFADCRVDISDSWIEQKAVEAFCGNKKEEEPDWYAIGCIDYYGVENFDSPYDGFVFSRKEVEGKLTYYTLPDDVRLT